MSVVVMILVGAAVLAWPGSRPAGCQILGRIPAGVVAPGDQADGDQAGVQGRGEAALGDLAPRGAALGPLGDGSAGEGTPLVGASSRAVVPAADVAGVIDLLALTLRGGVGVVEAMEAVANRVGGLLGMHLRTVAAAGRWGVDDATAWASVPFAWQPAARALRLAATAGVPPADVLVRAAQEVRRAEQQRLEVATATLGVRIVLPLGLAFLPAFVLTTVVPIVLALAKQVLVSP